MFYWKDLTVNTFKIGMLKPDIFHSGNHFVKNGLSPVIEVAC